MIFSVLLKNVRWIKIEPFYITDWGCFIGFGHVDDRVRHLLSISVS
jgi:hypothetical protein